MFPVDEPKNNFIAGISLILFFSISFKLEFVPPNIKEKLAIEFSLAMLNFLLSSSIVVVFGCVFGISKYEVMPPATAALDSE